MIKSTLPLVTVAFTAMLAQFVSQFLLTGYWSPQHMGQLATLTACVLVLNAGAGFCFPQILPLVKPVHYTTVFQLALLSAFVSALLINAVFIGVIFLQPDFFAPSTGFFFYSLLVVLPLMALQQCLQQQLHTQGRYKLAATSEAAALLVQHGGKLFFTLGYPLWFMVTAFQWFMPLLLSVTLMVAFRFTTPVLGFAGSSLFSWRKNRYRILASRFSSFPLFQFPQQLLNALSHSATVFLLTIWFGSAQTGFFALAVLLLSMPVLVVSKAMGHVLYPRYVLLQSQPDLLNRAMQRDTLLLLSLGLPYYVGMIVFAEPLVLWVFGDVWQPAGSYASVLAPWYWLVFSNVPAVKRLIVAQKQKLSLLLNMFTLILRVGAVSYFAAYGSVIQLMWALCFIGLLHNTVIIGLALKRT